MTLPPIQARSEKGQMAVELAIVTPVILLMLVIIVDMLVYANECARFDHMAPQQILACAVSSPSNECDLDSRSAAIESALKPEFEKNGSWVNVECSDTGALLASIVVYRCVLHFVPWPFSLSDAPPSIAHEYVLAVDPYTPGELL